MKNKFLLIALLTLTINACKRNEITENPNTAPFARKTLVIGDSITQVNCGSYSFLKFDDKDVFLNTMKLLADSTMTSEKAFGDFEDNFTFINLRHTIELLPDSVQREHYAVVSDVLATALSEDTLVQIDSLAFLISFPDSCIYELYPVNCATISLLKQKQEVNNDSMYIFRYNLSDPVFHPSGYEEEEEEEFQRRAWFRWRKKIFGGCDDTKPGPKRGIPGIVNYYTANGGTFTYYKLQADHNYNAYSIYFEIAHNFNHTDIHGTDEAIPVAFSHHDNWKEFCGGYGSDARWPNSIYGISDNFRFRTYQSSNSLASQRNLVKAYLWFQPKPNASISSPYPLNIPDLSF